MTYNRCYAGEDQRSGCFYLCVLCIIKSIRRRLPAGYEQASSGPALVGWEGWGSYELAIMAPPQHGKSWAATDFVCWVAGRDPDLKTILASYSADLGTRTNLDVQRIIKSPMYPEIFPHTQIGVHG
jgi:hypothetical protein